MGEFAGIHATTCGFYGSTADHNPVLGYEPCLPNLIRLVGFSGHGAMFGPFTMLVAQCLAEAGRNIDDIEVLGRMIFLAAFRLGRKTDHTETMVI